MKLHAFKWIIYRMENLTLEGTKRTPAINFDAQTGILEFIGRSIPENSLEFYQVLSDWADEYIELPLETTNLIFKLEYFNTSSSKCILDLLKKFEVLEIRGKNVFVKWYYSNEDEDMEESGRDFKEIVNLDFELVEKNSII